MREKYMATLDHIKAIPKNSNGYFTINYKTSAKELGLTVNTLNRRIKKFLDEGKLHLVYKGGAVLTKTCKDVILDADKFNDGHWEPRRNPNNFLPTMYTLNPISQYQRDVAVLRNVLCWQEKYLRHYQWWSKAETLEYIDNPQGLSSTTIELLGQFVKYMVKAEFSYDSAEYDAIYDKFTEMHTASEEKPSIYVPSEDIVETVAFNESFN